MSAASWAPTFDVVGAQTVAKTLAGHEPEIVDLVAATYLAHADAATVNPRATFLCFPDRPEARIIALPASLQNEPRVRGIKWIASFPRNVDEGLARASSVMILNDPDHGHPYACLESSLISAARTAASAALAATVLTRDRSRPRRLGVVGAGPIAGEVVHYLGCLGWELEIGVFDLRPERAESARTKLAAYGPVEIHPDIESCIAAADLVLFATVASRPHVLDPRVFDHHPVVLHLSLRDLGVEVVRTAYNVVDDVDHCLRADTSLHLLEQQVGHRDFVGATLAEVMLDARPVPTGTVVFSPFGLGALDLAVARWVYDRCRSEGVLAGVPDFFPPRAVEHASAAPCP